MEPTTYLLPLLFLFSSPTLSIPLLNINTTSLLLPWSPNLSPLTALLNTTTNTLCTDGIPPRGFGTSCEDALAQFLQLHMPGPPSTIYDFGAHFPLFPSRQHIPRVRLPAKAEHGGCVFSIEAVSRRQHGVMDRTQVGAAGMTLWQGCVYGGKHLGGKWETEGVRFVFGVGGAAVATVATTT